MCNFFVFFSYFWTNQKKMRLNEITINNMMNQMNKSDTLSMYGYFDFNTYIYMHMYLYYCICVRIYTKMMRFSKVSILLFLPNSSYFSNFYF